MRVIISKGFKTHLRENGALRNFIRNVQMTRFAQSGYYDRENLNEIEFTDNKLRKTFAFEQTDEGNKYWNGIILEYQVKVLEFRISFDEDFKAYLVKHDLFDKFLHNVKLRLAARGEGMSIYVMSFADINFDTTKEGSAFWLKENYDYRIRNTKYDITFEPTLKAYLKEKKLLKEFTNEVKQYKIRNTSRTSFHITHISGNFNFETTKKGEGFWLTENAIFDMQHSVFNITFNIDLFLGEKNIEPYLKSHGLYDAYVQNVKLFITNEGLDHDRHVRHFDTGFAYTRSYIKEGVRFWALETAKYYEAIGLNRYKVTFGTDLENFLEIEGILKEYITETQVYMVKNRLSDGIRCNRLTDGFAFDETEQGVEYWRAFKPKWDAYTATLAF